MQNISYREKVVAEDRVLVDDRWCFLPKCWWRSVADTHGTRIAESQQFLKDILNALYRAKVQSLKEKRDAAKSKRAELNCNR